MPARTTAWSSATRTRDIVRGARLAISRPSLTRERKLTATSWRLLLNGAILRRHSWLRARRERHPNRYRLAARRGVRPHPLAAEPVDARAGGPEFPLGGGTR